MLWIVKLNQPTAAMVKELVANVFKLKDWRENIECFSVSSRWTSLYLLGEVAVLFSSEWKFVLEEIGLSGLFAVDRRVAPCWLVSHRQTSLQRLAGLLQERNSSLYIICRRLTSSEVDEWFTSGRKFVCLYCLPRFDELQPRV